VRHPTGNWLQWNLSHKLARERKWGGRERERERERERKRGERRERRVREERGNRDRENYGTG